MSAFNWTKEPRWTERPRESPVPSADRSLPWIRAMWFCLPQMGYCGGGRKGIRCSFVDCVDRGRDHDPGDEDVRP